MVFFHSFQSLSLFLYLIRAHPCRYVLFFYSNLDLCINRMHGQSNSTSSTWASYAETSSSRYLERRAILCPNHNDDLYFEHCGDRANWSIFDFNYGSTFADQNKASPTNRRYKYPPKIYLHNTDLWLSINNIVRFSE